MPRHIAHLTYLVCEYDEAIAYCAQTLEFTLAENLHCFDIAQ